MRSKHALWIIGMVLVIALVSIVLGFNRGDYLSIEKTEAGLTSAYTHYRVCNPARANYRINNADDFRFTFNEVNNALTSSRLSIKENITWQRPVYTQVLVPKTCVRRVYTDNQTFHEEEQDCSYYGQQFDRYEQDYRIDWHEFIPADRTFEAGKCYDIRVEGDYPPKLGPTSIDNILHYAGMSFDEFDWWDASWTRKHVINVYVDNEFIAPEFMFNASQILIDLINGGGETHFPCDLNDNTSTNFSCLRLTEDDIEIGYQFLNSTYGNSSPGDAQYLMFFPSTSGNYLFRNYELYYGNETPAPNVARTLLDIYEPFASVTGIDGYKVGGGASIDNGVLSIPSGARPFWKFDEISTTASYTFEVKLSDCMGEGKRCLIMVTDETPDAGEYYEHGIYVVAGERGDNEIYVYYNSQENTICENCVYDGDTVKFDCDSGGCWLYIGDNRSAETPKIQYRSTADVSGWNMALIGALAGAAKIDDIKLSTSYNFTTYTEDMGYTLGNDTHLNNQSRIINLEGFDVSVYLLMLVQFYDEIASSWVNDSTVVDDVVPRKIEPGIDNKLVLGEAWNASGAWNTDSRSHGIGTYRIYVAATDENNAVLQNMNGSDMVTTYNFTITQPELQSYMLGYGSGSGTSENYRMTYSMFDVPAVNGTSQNYRAFIGWSYYRK